MATAMIEILKQIIATMTALIALLSSNILGGAVVGAVTPCVEQSVRISVESKQGQEGANAKADEIVRCHTLGIYTDTK